MFRQPNRVDVAATRAVATPKSWRSWVPTPEVEVLALSDQPRRAMLGWCTSSIDLESSPDVEVMCGGINTKTPDYAAVWRQGNLLHFGFEESPTELNDTGRALLENSIVYIARFGEDRPIPITPSGFMGSGSPRSRSALRRDLELSTTSTERLARHCGGALRGEIQAMGIDEAKQWIRENLGFLASNAEGRLVIDPEARALGVAIDGPDFLTEVLRRATDESSQAQALTLLARRVPDGPVAAGDLASWQAFLDSNREFLFFSETGGYVWLVDPLARKRGIPTRGLRGSLRASHGRGIDEAPGASAPDDGGQPLPR